jgi:hypothetical protein
MKQKLEEYGWDTIQINKLSNSSSTIEDIHRLASKIRIVELAPSTQPKTATTETLFEINKPRLDFVATGKSFAGWN